MSVYFSNVFAAGLLIMWGTMNLVHNVKVLMESEADQNWMLATLFILCAAILPFVVGIVLVLRVMPKSSGAEEAQG